MGGYLHGWYWRVNLDDQIVKLMHITAWETLASVINNLVAERLTSVDTILINRADAALTPRVLATRKSTSKHVQSSNKQKKANIVSLRYAYHTQRDSECVREMCSMII